MDGRKQSNSITHVSNSRPGNQTWSAASFCMAQKHILICYEVVPVIQCSLYNRLALVKMSLTPTLYTEKPLLTPGAWTSDLIAASTGLPGSNDGPWAKSSTLNHPMWPTIGFQKKKPHQIIMLEKKCPQVSVQKQFSPLTNIVGDPCCNSTNHSPTMWPRL